MKFLGNNGIGLNEAAVQLMTCEGLKNYYEDVKYYNLNLKTISPTYYPLECAILSQVCYFTGTYPLYHSTLYGDDIFKNTFITLSDNTTFYKVKNNLDKSITVTTSDTSTTCNLGSLTSQKNYYVQVDAYNNANLVASSDVITFKAVVTVEDAFTNTCGTGQYCSKGLYVNYNNYLFILYRETAQGYKAVYNSAMGNHNFLQSSCCNNGNCTYNGARYINGELSRYLNGTFVNNLPYYTSKLSRATWYTGPKSNVTSRSDTAYVGLMDYNEYLATKSYTFLYSGANNMEHWLLNPATTSSYVNNVTITYSNGRFYEGSKVVNTGAYARPVIVLKGNVEFTSGDGTINNPYRVL